MTFLLLMKIKKNILSKFWNIRIFCLSNKFMHLFYVMKAWVILIWGSSTALSLVVEHLRIDARRTLQRKSFIRC